MNDLMRFAKSRNFEVHKKSKIEISPSGKMVESSKSEISYLSRACGSLYAGTLDDIEFCLHSTRKSLEITQCRIKELEMARAYLQSYESLKESQELDEMIKDAGEKSKSKSI